MPHRARRPTIDDVARAAGVSRSAVSFAFNGRDGVSPDTRRRIIDAADELGYVPSHRARALSSSRALAAGLVMARTPETLSTDHFFPSFIAGVEGTLSARGEALLLQLVADAAAEEQAYRRLAAESRVDGVFLTDLRVDDPRPDLLDRLGLRAVMVAPTADRGGRPTVPVDDRPGITAAVEHLIGLGHTRIAHVAGPQNLVHGVSRREAWARALAAAGLPEGPCVVSDFSPAGGRAATEELLATPDPPTAIVYASDVMALAGMAAARAAGYSVPRDLSVVGFDDLALGAHLQPPLTTVATDAGAWGRAAALHLAALIDGHDPPAPDIAPPRLVVRGSTAPPPPSPRTDGPQAPRPPS